MPAAVNARVGICIARAGLPRYPTGAKPTYELNCAGEPVHGTKIKGIFDIQLIE